MTTQSLATPRRILAATDRSESADAAVRWAAELASSSQADLVVLQVVRPVNGSSSSGEPDMSVTAETLQRFATVLAGERGHARVAVSDDPAEAILTAIDEEAIDAVVVGNVGMAGRKEFLLGNIPNQVSHNARCTVIIVNTAQAAGAGETSRSRVRGMLTQSTEDPEEE